MRLVVITCTWKRPELTWAVLTWWTRIGKRLSGCSSCPFEMKGVAAGDHKRASEFWTCLDAPNEPLGRKHNIALRAARELDPDAVMIIGSDDIMETRLIKNSMRAIADGAMWTQPRELYFYHPESERIARTPNRAISGSGRVFSKRMLDAVNWQLWDDDAEYKLDGNLERRLETFLRSKKVVWGDVHQGWHAALGAEYVKGAVLAMKCGVNLWPYEDAVNTTTARNASLENLNKFEMHELGELVV